MDDLTPPDGRSPTDLTDLAGMSLAELEAVIETNLAGFLRVGAALAVIRDQEKYVEANYQSFDLWLQDYGRVRRRHADRLIQATRLVERMRPMGLIQPTSEREIRPVTSLPEEAWLPVMEDAKRAADADGQPLTSAYWKPVALAWREADRRRQQRLAEEAAGPLPVGLYRCLVIDPPWPVEKIEREVRPNQQRDLDYPTMTLDEIREKVGAAVRDKADPGGCHVYLWTTHKFLPAALSLFGAWGIDFQCLLTWVKPMGMTPYSWMYSTEHALFGTLGSLRVARLGLRLDFGGPAGRHSVKPDIFYDRVREASPARRLELFQRQPRDGFDGWGNEANGQELGSRLEEDPRPPAADQEDLRRVPDR